MTVEIETWFRTAGGDYRRFLDVERYSGDALHVPGAITMTVGGVEVFSVDMWDDIDWLWPYLIQASDECRVGGVGERYFPDQPILIRVERLGSSGKVRISLAGGPVRRVAVTDADDYFSAVGRAGLAFFDHLEALVPGQVNAAEIERIRRWGVTPD